MEENILDSNNNFSRFFIEGVSHDHNSITSVVCDNKLLTMFDVVRFGEFDVLNLETFKKFDDYHIILTHGIMPELINFFIDRNFRGLDPKKITVLSNNLEMTNLCIKKGITAHTISEYIFLNEEKYSMILNHKKIDCIFPGRPAKSTGLFKKSYDPLNILIMNQLKEYPISFNVMPQYYNMAKCGLMTTSTEGGCRAVGEMLSCGIPVVSVNIRTDVPENQYYPQQKTKYVYDFSLPNTLGGRELWLDDSNSLFCDRNDDSIKESIHTILSMELDGNMIRNNFLSKLKFQRMEFFYVLKTICDKLDINFFLLVNKMQEFINLPWENSTIYTQGWSRAKKHVTKSFQS